MITLTQHSKAHGTSKASDVKRPSGAVETAGSLAMHYGHGLLANNMQYDEFITSNPFNVDYGSYPQGETVAYGLFLNDFANAISTLSDCSTCDSGFSGFGGGGFSGGSYSGSSGGFSSVC